MFCRFCGAKNDDAAVFCGKCGKRLDSDPFQNSFNYDPFNNSNYNPFEAPMMTAKLSVKALVAFIVALSGLLIFALPSGIAGIILASLSLRDFSERKMKGKGLAITAFIISPINILFGILNIFMLAL